MSEKIQETIQDIRTREGVLYTAWYKSKYGGKTVQMATARQVYRFVELGSNFAFPITDHTLRHVEPGEEREPVRDFLGFERRVKAIQAKEGYITGRTPESSGVVYKNGEV